MTVIPDKPFIIPLQQCFAGLGCGYCDFSHRLNRYNDLTTILDKFLTEVRRISQASIGVVHYVENDKLHFSYAQNAMSASDLAARLMMYKTLSVPLDNKTIAGYAILTNQVVAVTDVHNLPAGVPFSFNPILEELIDEKPHTLISIPLGTQFRTLGVLQLINVPPDTITNDLIMDLVAVTEVVSFALERVLLIKELIVRMQSMSRLRDPAETAPHVKRVGTLAAELYHHWARRHSVRDNELRKFKDNLRLAAMLHDVGKVAIPDGILKKPGPLLPEERVIMQRHCMHGAGLFSNIVDSGIDAMAKDIAQHHHQKWDGTGYSGSDIVPVLSGASIPLAARITAVADVYDALMSKRCYKDPVSADKTLAIMQNESGKHFDPELIEILTEIQEIAQAIRVRYPDPEQLPVQ